MNSVRNIGARIIFPTFSYSATKSGMCVHRATMQAKIPTIYGDEASPPVRFVLMTACLLGIKLHFHKIDLFVGDNKTEFFTKINPCQKVPVLDTGKEIICDSHAIALYLCRLTPNDLYPEDITLQAKVDQMLFFNCSSLFPVDSAILTEHFGGKSLDSSKVENWNRLLDILEKQLETHLWLAGDKMTLCDFCCAATISSMGLLLTLSSRHAKIVKWMKKLEDIPCFEINSRGLVRLAGFIQNIKK